MTVIALNSAPSIVWTSPDEISRRIDADYFHFNFVSQAINNGYRDQVLLANCVVFFETGLSTFDKGDIPAKRIKTGNISNNFIDYDMLDDCQIKKHQSNLILKRGDILLTTYGTGSIGKIALVPFNTNWIPDYTVGILRANSDFDSGFLGSYLASKYGQEQIMRRVKGTTGITLVIKPDLINVKVIKPCQEVQQFIGNKVRKAEELREEARRLKQEAEDAFCKEFNIGGSSLNNKHYQWIEPSKVFNRIDANYYSPKYNVLDEMYLQTNNIRMGDLISTLKTGKTPPEEFTKDNGVPLVMVQNIAENKLDITDVKRRVDVDNYLLTEKGDLLITRVGSVGVCSVVEENEVGLVISDNVIVAKLNEGMEIPTRYVSYYLNSYFGKLNIERLVKGAVQGVINYPSIMNLMIPILPADTMQFIDNRILKWKDCLNKSHLLIKEAKQDVEDLIEGRFDESKVQSES